MVERLGQGEPEEAASGDLGELHAYLYMRVYLVGGDWLFGESMTLGIVILSAQRLGLNLDGSCPHLWYLYTP